MPSNGSVMENLEYRNHRLFWEDCELAAVAVRFRTPTYVYSRRRFEANYDRVEKAFAEVRHLICYSLKANSNLTLLSLLERKGAGFDVVSGGELERVRRAGIDTHRTVFSGVGKTEEEIDAGIACGLLLFNVESAGELDLLEKRALSLGKNVSVAVRINPNVGAKTHPYIATGQVVHKFGVPRAAAVRLYERIKNSKFLEARGVACHIGSQILDPQPHLEALKQLRSLADELRNRGCEIQYLDLGGGYGIRYQKEKPFDLNRLARDIGLELAGSPYRLILEPGRSLIGDAGILLAKVLYVKRNGPKSFVVLDAGMSDLIRPALYGSYHEIRPLERRGGEKFLADVVGPICETGDFLAQEREMDPVEAGDLVAVLTAGAYGFVLTSNYNSRLRPAEVLVDQDQTELIRPRENFEDLLRAEEQCLHAVKESG